MVFTPVSNCFGSNIAQGPHPPWFSCSAAPSTAPSVAPPAVQPVASCCCKPCCATCCASHSSSPCCATNRYSLAAQPAPPASFPLCSAAVPPAVVPPAVQLQARASPCKSPSVPLLPALCCCASCCALLPLYSCCCALLLLKFINKRRQYFLLHIVSLLYINANHVSHQPHTGTGLDENSFIFKYAFFFIVCEAF
jgi:hypothetical protein